MIRTSRFSSGVPLLPRNNAKSVQIAEGECLPNVSGRFVTRISCMLQLEGLYEENTKQVWSLTAGAFRCNPLGVRAMKMLGQALRVYQYQIIGMLLCHRHFDCPKSCTNCPPERPFL